MGERVWVSTGLTSVHPPNWICLAATASTANEAPEWNHEGEWMITRRPDRALGPSSG